MLVLSPLKVLLKVQNMGALGWPSGLNIWLLILAHVLISGSQDRAPHGKPPGVWWILLPTLSLCPSPRALSLSLKKAKQNNTKNKNRHKICDINFLIGSPKKSLKMDKGAYEKQNVPLWFHNLCKCVPSTIFVPWHSGIMTGIPSSWWWWDEVHSMS